MTPDGSPAGGGGADRRPSVCIVGMHFAPETTGNAPYTTAMAASLREHGFDVRVVTGVPHYPQWKVQPPYEKGRRWHENHDGVHVTRVRHAVPSVPGLRGRIAMESTFFARALPEINRQRSDIIIAVSPTLSGLAASVLRARARPVGVLVQDLNGNGAGESGVTGRRSAQAIGRMEYWLMRRAALVGVITPRFGEILIERGGVPKARLRDLPNFSHVSPVSATQSESRRRLGWNTEKFTVVHTGNMGRKQGLDVVVRAADIAQRDHPDWAFKLVGDGNQRSALQEAARGARTLEFVPPVDHVDYPHVLNAADVVVLAEKPGVREMSLPSKLTSYAVAGRPILASVDSTGIASEILTRYGAAVITKVGSAPDMIRGLAQLRSDSATAAASVAGARRLLEFVGGRAQAAQRYGAFADELLALAEVGVPGANADEPV